MFPPRHNNIRPSGPTPQTSNDPPHTLQHPSLPPASPVANSGLASHGIQTPALFEDQEGPHPYPGPWITQTPVLTSGNGLHGLELTITSVSMCHQRTQGCSSSQRHLEYRPGFGLHTPNLRGPAQSAPALCTCHGMHPVPKPPVLTHAPKRARLHPVPDTHVHPWPTIC